LAAKKGFGNWRQSAINGIVYSIVTKSNCKNPEKSKVKIEEKKWPSEIRLFVNKECNYRCSFPKTCVKWCHEDGFHQLSKVDKRASTEDFLFLAELLKKPLHLDKVKIGAMEPLLFSGIFPLIRGLKKIGYKEVSLTTNGYLLQQKVRGLKKSGLDTLTVSLHAFNRDDYRNITQVDAFDRVVKGIEEAKRIGINRVKVNRVLLNLDDSWDDLMRFFAWASKIQVTAVKLYQLIWSPDVDEKLFFENHSSWSSLLAFFAKKARLIRIKRYSASGRERLFWKLDSGLVIETDVFYHKVRKESPLVCQRCSFAPVCQEGIFSYGLEISCEMLASACLLRENLSVDLWDLVKKRKRKQIVSQIDHFMRKFGTHSG
jgi:cyclic pyranopterin phosphate synthase